MVGGVNEVVVVEMFRSYQHKFRLENLNIIGDNDDEVYLPAVLIYQGT